MGATRRVASADLFDDPPWDTELPTSRPGTTAGSLAISAAAALVLALSTALPWYSTGGLAETTFSARSRWLLPRLGTSAHAPGTAAWGDLIFMLGLAVALVAAVCAVLAALRPALGAAVSVLAASTAAALAAVVVMELGARPPFGDGPALTPAWGAGIGAIAAGVSVAAAAWAAVRSIRRMA